MTIPTENEMLSTDRMYKLILSAENIPDGASVAKLNGAKIFTLRKKLVIYGQIENDLKTIKPEKGVVFLVYPCTGNITAISDKTDLIWEIDGQRLMEMFQEYQDYQESK
jgi:hypothetical protein